MSGPDSMKEFQNSSAYPHEKTSIGSGPASIRINEPNFSPEEPPNNAPNPMMEAAKRSTLESQPQQYIPETSALGYTFNFVEKGGVPEALKSPENSEILDEIQEEMTRTLFEPITLYIHDSRTGFTTPDWQMNSTRLQIESMENTLKIKSSVHRPYKPERGRNDEEKKELEKRQHIHEVYQSRVKEEVTRLASYGHIAADGMGPMGMYFDGKTMVGLNQRRLTVTPIDRFRLAFGVHKDKVLRKYKEAVAKDKEYKKKGSETPEEVKKLLVENAPKFFEEGFSDQVKRDAAEMHDMVNVLSEMNKRNVFAGKENEMRIKPEHLSITEQEFVGALFRKQERIDEHGKKVSLGNDATQKIKIYLDEKGGQMAQNANGEPVDSGGNVIDLKTNTKIIEREFYINLLTYENTTSSEEEHKKFISLLMAYTMLKDTKTGQGVRDVLQGIVQRNPDLKLGLSEDEISTLPVQQHRDYKLLELLVAKVEETSQDLIEDWDSPRVRQEREAAAAAFELNFMVECASAQIANIGHWYHWERNEIMDPVSHKGTGRYEYKYLDEIGDPDMAFDAMTAMFIMQHEYTYSAIKNRVSTPLLPPVDPKYAEKIVNFVVQGGSDPEIVKYAENDEYIARFYGIVGLFKDQLKDNEHWKEGEEIRLRQKRADGTQRECSEEFIQSLEQTMFGVPTIYGDKVFPMPIAPFFNLTLFDSMHVSKDKTVQDLLNERKLLTDINWEMYHPFAGDGTDVSGRFTTDMTYIMYGAADAKGLAGFFGNPFEAIRKIVKSMDIGTRSNVRLIDFKTKDEKGNNIITKKPINKKFHEITYSTYLPMAYLSFVKFDMFSGGDKWQNTKESFLSPNSPKLRDENPGVINYGDYLEAFSYQLNDKQGSEHYGDAMYLLFMGLREVVEGISKLADDYYANKVLPVYKFEGKGAQDPLSLKRNVGYRTTNNYKQR